MKTHYSTPTLTANGDFSTQTKSPMISVLPIDGVPFQKPNSFGDVGFGL